MPRDYQNSVTLRKDVHAKAKKLAENDKTAEYPEGKPVAKKVTELIEEEWKTAGMEADP